MSFYELAILGDATPADRATLTSTIAQMVEEFGLALDSDVIVHDGVSIARRDKHVAFAAVYFGGSRQADLAPVREAIQASAPVIPFVGPGFDFGTGIPDFL